MSFSTKERKRVAINFKDDQGLTEQHHKDSCDIHNILRQQEKTGVAIHSSAFNATYGTMPTGEQFHQDMNRIARAKTLFESVPSKIRNEFDNDVAKYLDFMHQDENYEKIQEMGLPVDHLTKPEEPVKTEVEIKAAEALPAD
jgi:hypothetical protein